MAGEILIFGGLLLDRYFSIEKWPVRGQDGYFTGETSFVGGCAVNMAATIRNLGGNPQVVSCIGDDAVGSTIRMYCRDAGLSEQYLFDTLGTTGSCLVFSELDGERTFLTQKGVEERFPLELEQNLQKAAPGWIGVTGYYLLSQDGEAILRCLERLSSQGSHILFDPSPLVGDIQPGLLNRIVKICQIMTPNQVELLKLGGTTKLSSWIHEGKTVILKQGEQGGRVFTPTGEFSYPAAPCRAIDTTGAGDSFSGALLWALDHENSIQQAVILAARCAAKTAEVRQSIRCLSRRRYWRRYGDASFVSDPPANSYCVWLYPRFPDTTEGSAVLSRKSSGRGDHG